jgi:hypothetical protein
MKLKMNRLQICLNEPSASKLIAFFAPASYLDETAIHIRHKFDVLISPYYTHRAALDGGETCLFELMFFTHTHIYIYIHSTIS